MTYVIRQTWWVGTVFKDIISKEILIWKHINSELVIDYKQQLQVLLDLGYKVQAIIIDGKRGLYKAFKDYPVQISEESHTKIYNYASKIRSW